jgi:site-specific recombinase XerD
VTEERTTPLRERMIEDMRIRGLGEKSQKAHIRGVKEFARFLMRSPDAATPDDLRAYQLHMTNAEVAAPTFNARIAALRFFFGVTCGREEMKRYMQFRTKPWKLPVVLSVEEVSDVLKAAPGPGLKYRAALSISYGAGHAGRTPPAATVTQRPASKNLQQCRHLPRRGEGSIRGSKPPFTQKFKLLP